MNIIDSGNYLVQLYFKTGKKYNLTATKLNYLLLIAELCHLKNGFIGYLHSPFSFVETSDAINPYQYIGFPAVSEFYYSDIVVGELEENGDISEEIDESVLIPENYYIKNEMEPDEVNLLNDIFYKYGNLSSINICNMLSSVLDKIKFKLNKKQYYGGLEYTCDGSVNIEHLFDDIFKDEYEYISKDSIESLLDYDISKEENNIICFVLSHTMEKSIEKDEIPKLLYLFENVNDEEKKSRLYSKTYYRALEQAMRWPNWKKELANTSLLVSKHAKKLPLYIDGEASIKELDTIRLVDASFEYLDLDGNSYDASDEVVVFPLIKKDNSK